MGWWQVCPDKGGSFASRDKEAADNVGTVAHRRFEVPVILVLPIYEGNSTLIAMS